MERIRVEEYGSGPGPVFVLHGGPGAPGSAGPLARALAKHFQVFEPWQRRSGEVPLSVSRHIEDLMTEIESRAPRSSVALVGESWGAMLALAFAAEHPSRVRAIALVGCGTFDLRARAELLANLKARTTPELEAAMHDLEAKEPDPEARFAAGHRLQDRLYTYARDADAGDGVREADLAGHVESWNDMILLQEEGVYPAAFSRIDCPTAMFHGDYDPHPGPRIRESLEPHLPQLEYVEFERCGHDPLVERHARVRYLETLGDWLATQLAGASGSD